MTFSSSSYLVRVKAKLNPYLLKHASGLLDGGSASVFRGTGMDFDELTLYSPGDDVSDIDWKASASSDQPLIKRFIEYRNRNIVLIVDTGRNMAALAPSGESKRDLVLYTAGLMCYLGQSHGDVIGLFGGDARRLRRFPLRSSTAFLETMLRSLDRAISVNGPASDLARPLNNAFKILNRRAFVVVISDEVRPLPEHENLFRRLKARHDVLYIAIADASPLSTSLQDTEVRDIDMPLELPKYVRSKTRLSKMFDEHAERRRKAALSVLARQRVKHTRIQSIDEVVPNVLSLLREHKGASRSA